MEKYLETLSLEEKIGQMLIVGIEGKNITERTKNLILKYKIGGVILYRKNFSTYNEMVKLINDLKSLNKENKVPLFIAIDQEWGRVNRMPEDFLNLPAAGLLADKLGTQGVTDVAQITGEILKKSGINMNFAPVLDIRRIEKSNIVGDRSFSNNKEKVSECGIAQIKEFQNKQVVPVAKHFPGHGATKDDSHFKLPKIKISITEIENEDMYPFGQAIKNGADAILVGHLKIKDIDEKLPCTLSKRFLIKYLRKKYHYKGLIISDDLKMKAVRYRYGTTKSAVKAINSGNDMIIFRFNQKQETKTIETLIKLAQEKRLNHYRINASVNRILKIKEKYEVNDDIVINELDIQNINNKIQNIRKKVLGKD